MSGVTDPSASQIFVAACLLLAVALFALAAALPTYLASVRRWYDAVDALEESRPELARDWYAHMPIHIRPLRRWIGCPPRGGGPSGLGA